MHYPGALSLPHRDPGCVTTIQNGSRDCGRVDATKVRATTGCRGFVRPWTDGRGRGCGSCRRQRHGRVGRRDHGRPTTGRRQLAGWTRPWSRIEPTIRTGWRYDLPRDRGPQTVCRVVDGWTRPWLGRRCGQPRNHEPLTARAAVAGWTKPWPGLTPTPRLCQCCGRSRDHGRGRVGTATGWATAGCR